MHLTRFTDLSLRVLMYLTYRNRSTLVTVNELAEKFDWSRNHIVKVAHFLHTKGWIVSYRGRTGGLELARDPSEYRIGDIVRELEGGQPLLDCDSPMCTMFNGCQFREVKEEAYRAFYDKLNEHTLASMTDSLEARDLIRRLNEEARKKPATRARGPLMGSVLIKPRARSSAKAKTKKAAE